jgi:predicted TIM-barrel fold metal-dependent hydrolase
MIVDGHCHWLPPGIIENAHFYSPAWGDIQTQLGEMRAQGITRALLTYPTTDAHVKLGGMKELARIYNDAVAGLLKRYSQAFAAACCVPVGESVLMLDEVRRAVEELGFRGLSLASSYEGEYLDAERFLPVFEYCQRQGLPVFVHSQTQRPIGSERVQDPLLTPVVEYMFDMTMSIGTMLMAGLFQKFPGVPFVFANFGGAVTFLRARFDATYRMLRERQFVKDLGGEPTQYLKNIYLDTGGDTLRENFQLALELVGADHIIWGSDWPAKKDARGSISAVRALDIPEVDKDKILGGNLARLLAY